MFSFNFKMDIVIILKWSFFIFAGLSVLQSSAQSPRNYTLPHFFDSVFNSADAFDFLRDSYKLPNGLKQPLREYDFVIIGAGSAGCALASRLTKNRNTTVLLIETGKPEMLLTDIPVIAAVFQSTDYVWPYYMERQEGVCMGMENKRCYWPRGKAVGGTSVVNYMIYTRGRPAEWDRIAADGNYGWSYENILKYYVEMEKANLGGYEKQPHRGREGEVYVNFAPVRTKTSEMFLGAARSLGHPIIDYNAPEKLGFGRLQATIKNGRRYSAAKAFLHKHKTRPNLHILTEATATQVLIDRNTKTAYGVEFMHKNKLHKVVATKEVILSAGPIASPQLLMLSGIGPKDHLNDMNIPVIQNLPVGRTLYDHITFPGLVFTFNVTDVSLLEWRTVNLASILRWMQFGDNELAIPGAVEAIGYIKTSVSDDPDPTVPDIELISIGGSLLSDGGPGGSKATRRGMKITETFESAYNAIDGTDSWTAFPMLLHPKSVGHLELKDKNPFSFPRLYANYLTDAHDVATFVAAIRYIQKLTSTKAFQQYGAKLYPGKYKYCMDYKYDTDEYWECAVRTLTATLHHQIATCKMGPYTDPTAVVDPELRVIGVNRLRVVDSSVIPRTLSTHTHAPAMVIGLKAAEMIKSTWKLD